jgi:hypothetical protein
VEATPESKRLRTQQLTSDVASNTSDTSTLLLAQIPPISTTAHMPASFNTFSQQSHPQKPSAVSQPITQQSQIIDERLRMAEMQLQRTDEAIYNANNSGNTQLADKLKLKRDKQLAAYLSFKAAIAAYAQSHGRPGLPVQQDAGNASGTSVLPNVIGAMNLQSSLLQVPSPSNKDKQAALSGSDNGAHGQDAQAVMQHARNDSASSASPQLSKSNQGASPSPSHGLKAVAVVQSQIASQLQKKMEQQRNLPPHLSAPQALADGTEPGGSVNAPPVDFQQLSTSVVWQGALVWQGSDATTQGRKEVRSQVVASVLNGCDRFILAAYTLLNKSLIVNIDVSVGRTHGLTH